MTHSASQCIIKLRDFETIYLSYFTLTCSTHFPRVVLHFTLSICNLVTIPRLREVRRKSLISLIQHVLMLRRIVEILKTNGRREREGEDAGERRRVSNRVARYAFNEILDDTKTTTSTIPTTSTTSATASATIAVVVGNSSLWLKSATGHRTEKPPG